MLDAEDILLGREALVDQLAAYKKLKSHRITVVFDGGSAPVTASRRHQQKGIRVYFSRAGETADTLIKRLARSERERALVVSSDRDVAKAAASSGAATIGAVDFEQKLLTALFGDRSQEEEDNGGGWRPTTKKKGPARRQSRRKRFNRKKIRKL